LPNDVDGLTLFPSTKALVFDLEDAVAAAKEGYPRILALVQDTLEVWPAI